MLSSINNNLFRKPAAVEYGRPAVVEPLQDWFTLSLHLETHGPTGGDHHRLVHLLRTHRSVHGAQEERQEPRASELDEGDELMHLELGVLLVCVPHQVRHSSHVVLHGRAQRDGDSFTASPLRR